MNDNTQRPGRGQIWWLASSVADGTATHKEARELLEEFVRQADEGQVSERIIQHLRDCVAAFLAGKKTLDPAPSEGRDAWIGVPIPTLEKAFGLTRVAPGHLGRELHTIARGALGKTRLTSDGQILFESERDLSRFNATISRIRDVAAKEEAILKRGEAQQQEGLQTLRSLSR